MSFRKEEKFRLSISDFFEIQKILKSKGMTKIYKTRIINSLYFDNYNLNMFIDSEEGILPRKKIRIRWYNNSDDFLFEKKISSIEGRYKTTTKIKELSHVNLYDQTFFDQNYGNLFPSMLVSYERTYFKLNNVRVTFDSNITYKNTRLLRFNKIIDAERVMEIKASVNDSDDFIRSLVPYKTSRYSKYCRGISITRGEI